MATQPYTRRQRRRNTQALQAMKRGRPKTIIGYGEKQRMRTRKRLRILR